MKAIAVIAFLAFFGIASASLFQQQAVECTPSGSLLQQMAPNCDFVSDGNPANLCNDNCFGEVCESFKAKSQSECIPVIAQICQGAGQSVPSECSDEGTTSPNNNNSGAVALVTIRGGLVVVLLLAAFFVL